MQQLDKEIEDIKENVRVMENRMRSFNIYLFRVLEEGVEILKRGDI